MLNPESITNGLCSAFEYYLNKTYTKLYSFLKKYISDIKENKPVINN